MYIFKYIILYFIFLFIVYLNNNKNLSFLQSSPIIHCILITYFCHMPLGYYKFIYFYNFFYILILTLFFDNTIKYSIPGDQSSFIKFGLYSLFYYLYRNIDYTSLFFGCSKVMSPF
ncbi:hypothetical protein SLOPH_690 [Spraguea lophii 42_110]|uniref:Uncharacterized protein n=1 Tax=Spraguea lophii (strain 42_110) TaxID=1358809 RepID=S7WD17_SPRLO|nr:hypothetical protein SLOPH_690 [Spraguea lophii 42_110]